MAKQTSKSKQSGLPRGQRSDSQAVKRTARSRFTPEYGVMLGLLKEETARSGVTQEKIAECLGKTQSHVSMCLNKEREVNFVDLWKWCDAIGIDFAKFVGRFEEAAKSLWD